MAGIFKNKQLILVLFLFIAGISGTFFCKSENTKENQSKENQEMRDINLVLKANTRDVMAIPGVVGIYVGETEDNKPCLKVMVVKETEEIKKKLPRELEGYPVLIHVTGEIKPMQ